MEIMGGLCYNERQFVTGISIEAENELFWKWSKDMSETMTGYPSIDKPWKKYYDHDIPNKPKDLPWSKYHTADCAWNGTYPEETRYHMIKEVNYPYPDQIALNYFNREWTFKQLFEDIDKAAQALSAAGLRKGDALVMTVVNTPEVVHVMYAASKMGICVNMCDPRSDAATLKHYIQECDAKLFLTLNLNLPLVQKACVGTSVRKIVVLSVGRSMPKVIRFAYNLQSKKEYPHLKNINYDDTTVSYDTFLAAGEGVPVPEEVPYDKDFVAVLMHTGGTTGMPKSVVYTEEHFACLAWEYAYVGVPLARQQRWYNELPPFIIFGFGICIHVAMFYGLYVILSPKFDPQGFPKQLKKYKPQHVCGVPEHFRQMARSKELAKEDMSWLMTAAIGGDAMPVEEEERINTFLKEHNCPYKLIKGYGMTETCATATTESQAVNAIMSVGMPMAKTVFRIMDPEDYGRELKYNETGEVWIHSPRLMVGYLHDQHATDEMIFTDENGTRWLHSGDLGHINEDGLLFITGRIRRIYMTDNAGNGAKIFPFVPEDVIRAHKDVDEVCVAGRYKKDSTFYEVVAFITKENDRPDAELTAELKALVEEQVPVYMHPVDYIYIDHMPRTPNNGKVDFKTLEKRAAELQK